MLSWQCAIARARSKTRAEVDAQPKGVRDFISFYCRSLWLRLKLGIIHLPHVHL